MWTDGAVCWRCVKFAYVMVSDRNRRKGHGSVFAGLLFSSMQEPLLFYIIG